LAGRSTGSTAVARVPKVSSTGYRSSATRRSPVCADPRHARVAVQCPVPANGDRARVGWRL